MIVVLDQQDVLSFWWSRKSAFP